MIVADAAAKLYDVAGDGGTDQPVADLPTREMLAEVGFTEAHYASVDLALQNGRRRKRCGRTDRSARQLRMLLANVGLDLLVGPRRQSRFHRRFKHRGLKLRYHIGHLALQVAVDVSKFGNERMLAAMLKVGPDPTTGNVDALGHESCFDGPES